MECKEGGNFVMTSNRISRKTKNRGATGANDDKAEPGSENRGPICEAIERKSC